MNLVRFLFSVLFILFYQGVISQTPQICLVTVDTAINKNIVAWEKTLFPATSYNIYKETTINNYILTGNVFYSSLSVFTDYSSDPKTKSYRYRISTIDSLGNESTLSDSAKTMHLTINLGINNEINMIWEGYEGIPYSVFYIYRSPSFSSPMVLIDSVPYSIYYYTDWSPPATDTLCYMIAIRISPGCSATDPPTFFDYSLSNISCMDYPLISNLEYRIKQQPSIVFDSHKQALIILPEKKIFSLQIFNPLGQMLFAIQNNSDKIIAMNNLRAGLLFYKITFEGNSELAGKILIP